MIFWGTLASQFERKRAPTVSNWRVWVLNFTGVILALYALMADTLAAVPRGLDAVCDVLPEKFHWPLFCVAWWLMAAPALQIGWQRLKCQRTKSATSRTIPELDPDASAT
jgi:hypothetical protein